MLGEAEIVKLITKTVEQQSPNNLWLGFVLLGGLYVIKELWGKLQEKSRDPEGEKHREETRKKITHIEDRQSTIMDSIEDIRTTLKYIERELERMRGKT